MISEIVAFSAVCISFAALIFSWISFKKDLNKDYQGLIYREKLMKYQEILKIGRFLVFQSSASAGEDKVMERNQKTARLFDISDECMLLVPAEIARAILDLAFTAEKLNKARLISDKNAENEVYGNASDALSNFIVIAHQDLGLGRLNKLLLERIKN